MISLSNRTITVETETEEYSFDVAAPEIEDAACEVFIKEVCPNATDNEREVSKTVMKKYSEYYGIDRLIKEYSFEIAEKLFMIQKQEGLI